MFIELIDLLRCTKPHDETWLVAAFNTVSNRFVQEGKLGCPTCSAEYWIRDGVGDFSGGVLLPACDSERAATSHSREELATRAVEEAAKAFDPVRSSSLENARPNLRDRS